MISTDTRDPFIKKKGLTHYWGYNGLIGTEISNQFDAFDLWIACMMVRKCQVAEVRVHDQEPWSAAASSTNGYPMAHDGYNNDPVGLKMAWRPEATIRRAADIG
jgi:hypothetical protein